MRFGNDAHTSINTEERIAELERENRRLKRQLKNIQDMAKRTDDLALGKVAIDRVRDEERRKQERYMHLLLSNSPDIILMFDQNGRFTNCTDSFLKMAGIQGFGLINGRHFKEVFASYGAVRMQEETDRLFNEMLLNDQAKTVMAAFDIGGHGARNYQIHSAASCR